MDMKFSKYYHFYNCTSWENAWGWEKNMDFRINSTIQQPEMWFSSHFLFLIFVSTYVKVHDICLCRFIWRLTNKKTNTCLHSFILINIKYKKDKSLYFRALSFYRHRMIVSETVCSLKTQSKEFVLLTFFPWGLEHRCIRRDLQQIVCDPKSKCLKWSQYIYEKMTLHYQVNVQHKYNIIKQTLHNLIENIIVCFLSTLILQGLWGRLKLVKEN